MSAPDLFTWATTQYPAKKRDPLTSYESAEAIGPHIPQLETLVLEALRRHGGLTSEELAAGLGLSVVTVSPRLRPLERKGRVRRDGVRRNISGKNATVWVAV